MVQAYVKSNTKIRKVFKGEFKAVHTSVCDVDPCLVHYVQVVFHRIYVKVDDRNQHFLPDVFRLETKVQMMFQLFVWGQIFVIPRKLSMAAHNKCCIWKVNNSGIFPRLFRDQIVNFCAYKTRFLLRE